MRSSGALRQLPSFSLQKDKLFIGLSTDRNVEYVLCLHFTESEWLSNQASEGLLGGAATPNHAADQFPLAMGRDETFEDVETSRHH